MDKNVSFAGLNGFVWWTGVVENRVDPLNLGRCQVRMFGWHTEDLQLIPSKDLPWALPMRAVNTPKQDSTPVEGEWVVGFFTDGVAGQFPVIMGVIPGIPTPYDGNLSKGFCDQRTDLSKSPIPFGLTEAVKYPRLIGEPTTSRLYRNENIDSTQIGARNASLTTNIPVSDGSTWNEPKSPYATVPPYNDIKESESGHLFELDDTPGAERVDIAHRSGTYVEMRPDGSKVTKVLGDNYEVILGSDWIYVKGTCNITIGGDANIQVSGSVTALVEQDMNVDVKGNSTVTVDGDLDATVQGDTNLTVGGNVNAQAQQFNLSGQINQTSGGIVTQGDILAGSINLL